MATRLSFPALIGLIALLLALLLRLAPAYAAPYAAMVIDARSGEVLHSRNADTRLHPASLTKMMTLYVAFEAIEHGEISLDTKVTISRRAASEPPSKLGLRAGQKIALRYLIRAAAVKSANDAATAIGEAISGSEAAFARRMNRTAKAMGMSRTTFKNAHGLTEAGHLSTARDMTTLGRHLFYDHSDYYNLFSRKQTSAGMRDVANTNRRFLGAYRGADGIKTGYTRAAGFNLVASARRGQERIIATVFGGRSTATRNARVAELLDMGFKRAPSQVAVNRPARPTYQGDGSSGTRVATALGLRPRLRPGSVVHDGTMLAMASGIENALQDAAGATPNADAAVLAALAQDSGILLPQLRPSISVSTKTASVASSDTGTQVVSRVSTSGERYWGVHLGRYTTRNEAERMLLKTALAEIGMLGQALRKVVPRGGAYEANFVGLTRDGADLACRRLSARAMDCSLLGPT
jgi:D-alanyl-D-alanine carboxypeptidase